MINAVVVKKLNEIKFEFKFKCVYDHNLSLRLFRNEKKRDKIDRSSVKYWVDVYYVVYKQMSLPRVFFMIIIFLNNFIH